MKRARTIRLQDLIGLIHALYPPSLAEDWDNVGLQVGDPGAAIDKVLVCLDPSDRALDAALDVGAQAILSHHPLIFRPLKSLTPADATGRLLLRAVREGVAVVCAHTNLDRGQNGLNDWLAARLGLTASVPLAGGASDLLKLVVFVPQGHEDAVAAALFAGGAGKIGGYDRCSFRTAGTGTFRPGPGTRPFLGGEGEDAAVAEIRLETVLPAHLLSRVVSRMIKAHPYEEIAYDLIPLANRRADVGLGRIGRLAAPTTLGAFAEGVKAALGLESLRCVGPCEQVVSKVAVCGGSGASLLGEAARQGADLLVTGDVKYHEAQKALECGVALIDAGHFATERPMVLGLAQTLDRAVQERGWTLSCVPMEGEQDPFQVR